MSDPKKHYNFKRKTRRVSRDLDEWIPERRKEVRLTQDEQDAIQEKADIHTNGNMSMWMVYASLHHNPKR